MAAVQEFSDNVGDIIRRKMVRIPNLRPKVKLGQRTLGKDPATNKQYQQLKKEYYQNPSELQPFLTYLHGRIITDGQLTDAPSGIYTWIIKRGKLHASPLMTNQEIGSLHINMNTLTIRPDNLGVINRTTLKNTRNSSAKPIAAGELLLTRSVDGIEKEDAPVRIYFNIQSGTFSEPLLKCRVKTRAEQRGIVHPKMLKNVTPQLKLECRDEMVGQIHQTMSDRTGIAMDNVRFLSCDESIQQELQEVPLLLQGKYEFGSCREEDDYFESLAGRNLIRRFTMYTSAENRNRLNMYFNDTDPSASASPSPSPSPPSYGKAPSSRQTKKINKSPYSKQGGNYKQGGKRQKSHRKRNSKRL